MSKPEPKWTRGQLRIWLKWVLKSGLLDRLPPHYDAEGASRPATPEEVARRLLAGLQDLEQKGPALAPVVAEAHSFTTGFSFARKRPASSSWRNAIPRTSTRTGWKTGPRP